MSMIAFFITAKIWKQTQYPSKQEWLNKLWHIRSVVYYSMIKRNKLSSFEKTWRKHHANHQVKGANLKRLHTVWLYLYDILEKWKCRDRKEIRVWEEKWEDELVEPRKLLRHWNYFLVRYNDRNMEVYIC